MKAYTLGSTLSYFTQSNRILASTGKQKNLVPQQQWFFSSNIVRNLKIPIHEFELGDELYLTFR